MPELRRLQIAAVYQPSLVVEAQYNPKELQLDRSVPWSPHDPRDNRPWWKRTDAPAHDLEYTGAQPRTLSLELLFDGYETNQSVEPIVGRLDELACIKDPSAYEDADRAPPLCMLVWGTGEKFRCVIESLATKFTMFSREGVALRAVCSIKLKEAVRVVPKMRR